MRIEVGSYGSSETRETAERMFDRLMLVIQGNAFVDALASSKTLEADLQTAHAQISELERLRAENERLRATALTWEEECNSARDAHDSLQAENERLQHQLTEAHRAARGAEEAREAAWQQRLAAGAEVERLTARVAELETVRNDRNQLIDVIEAERERYRVPRQPVVAETLRAVIEAAKNS